MTDGALVAEALRVSLPEERPAVRAVAAEARTRLGERLSALSPAEREQLAATPLTEAAIALDRHPRWKEYFVAAPALADIEIATAADGAEWTATYAQLVILELLARVDRREPELRIPEIHWPDVEVGLRVLVDAPIATSFEGWRSDMFLKDLAVAQLRLLPNRGMADTAISQHPRFMASNGSLRQRLALARYLGRDFFRPGLYEISHAWRGFLDGRREPWVRRNLPIAALIAVNPHIRGRLNGGWLNDPALATITPHLWERTSETLRRGGKLFEMATGPDDIARALATSKTRRRLYDEGKYRPRVHGMITRRSDIVRWARTELVEAQRDSNDGG